MPVSSKLADGGYGAFIDAQRKRERESNRKGQALAALVTLSSLVHHSPPWRSYAPLQGLSFNSALLISPRGYAGELISDPVRVQGQTHSRRGWGCRWPGSNLGVHLRAMTWVYGGDAHDGRSAWRPRGSVCS